MHKLDLDNPEVRRQIMREMGSRGGLKGGKARAMSMSATDRSECARKAACARWDAIRKEEMRHDEPLTREMNTP